MKKKKTVRVMLLAGCLTMFSLPAFAENITLTTYYPAPFGAYDQIKLVPRESLPLDPHCDDDKDAGKMYYDNGVGEKDAGIYVCQKISPDTLSWVLMSGFLPPKEEEAAKDEKDKKDEAPVGKPVISNQKVVCVGPDGKMGVCLNNPSADGTCACQQEASRKCKK